MNAIFEQILFAGGLVFAGTYFVLLCVLLHSEFNEPRNYF
jgi:hypothetical protein